MEYTNRPSSRTMWCWFCELCWRTIPNAAGERTHHNATSDGLNALETLLGLQSL